MDSLYQTIINSLSSGMVTVNKQGTIISANNPAVNILGFNDDGDLLGKNVEEVMPGDGQDANPFIESIKGKKALKRREYVLKNKKGEKVYLGITTSLIEDGDSNVKGVVGLMTDLTKVKTMQDKLKQKENLAILGEMTAVMAHEIKNPLTGIKFGIEYLKSISKGNSDAIESIELILKEINQLERIAKDMTNFTRMPQVNSEKFDLIGLIGEKIKIHLPEAKVKGVEVEYETDKDVPEYNGDPYLLGEVFNNLIINSLEAFGEKGGEKRVNVFVSYDDKGSVFTVRIKDNGVGIPKENQKKVFIPFFTTKRGGTGLGLPTVQRIIVAHNGSIELNSVVGEGTEFIVELPQIVSKG
ncbi:MAG: PAS domain S-box protein [Proteobacteria bacterium]|nr:PAS domain S-box protein [Pseudomonadota bacterium]